MELENIYKNDESVGGGVGASENPDEPHRSIKRAEIADTLSSIYIVLARLQSHQCPPFFIDKLLPIGRVQQAPPPCPCFSGDVTVSRLRLLPSSRKESRQESPQESLGIARDRTRVLLLQCYYFFLSSA